MSVSGKIPDEAAGGELPDPAAHQDEPVVKNKPGASNAGVVADEST